jgi:hypothetical protein
VRIKTKNKLSVRKRFILSLPCIVFIIQKIPTIPKPDKLFCNIFHHSSY